MSRGTLRILNVPWDIENSQCPKNSGMEWAHQWQAWRAQTLVGSGPEYRMSSLNKDQHGFEWSSAYLTCTKADPFLLIYLI